jgi:hypothetical protein
MDAEEIGGIVLIGIVVLVALREAARLFPDVAQFLFLLAAAFVFIIVLLLSR